MFTLTKEFRFEASHQLPKHDGKCQRLHGHSWRGKLVVQSPALIQEGPKSGMVMDFYDLSLVLGHLLENYLDHYHLNETTKLADPTSEELARWIYNRIKPSVASLVAVIIEETCTSSAEYRP